MRVYLPATLLFLADVLRKGEIGPAPLRAFAVTPALREWYATGDQEELEYAAMTQAARASLRLLQATPGAPPRRVVLAADIPDDQITTNGGFTEPALAELAKPVPLSLIASAHIDDTLATSDIAKAVAALAPADAGDEDAQFTVDGAEGHDLLWYATQELPYVAQ
jgi:uncharacterized protein DUF6912